MTDKNKENDKTGDDETKELFDKSLEDGTIDQSPKKEKKDGTKENSNKKDN